MKKVSLRSLTIGTAFAAGLIVTAGTAQAIEYNFGEVKMNIDTTVSMGIGIRASGQDCTHVNTANGGCLTESGVAYGVNDDDGNINTGAGDIYSSAVKVTTEMLAKYKNYGAFVRVKAFYDYWIDQELGDHSGRFGNRPTEDARRGDDAHDAGARGIDLLDAFVYGNFNVGDMPLTLRAGNQVINWGESLAIPGGISSYLPVDLGAIRTPGAQLKEAYQPVPALYASLGLPGNVSLEGFWQLQWKKTTTDACGTFFSGSDAYCQGGAYVMSNGDYPSGLITIPVVASQEGDDTGTYGVSVKYYADWLNNGTDTGLYYVHYSSTLPIGTFSVGTTGLDATTLGGDCVAGSADPKACLTSVPFLLGFLGGANTKTSLAQYPEDIETLGASFNTVVPILGGSAFSGEVAYSHDMPFQLSDVEINCSDLADANIGGVFGVPNSSLCGPHKTYNGAGTVTQGYDRYNVITSQLSLISTLPTSNAFTSLLGSDIVVLVANAGFQYIPGLTSSNNRLAAPRSATTHANPIVAAVLGDASCKAGGCPLLYADPFSWGYRLIGSTDYNNAFGTAWTMSPHVSFRHDVHGTSAGPIGPGFVEGKKAISLGVTADLQSSLKVSVDYTFNWGNPYRNFSSDKDFATASISYAF